ncbi:MAG TPA: glycosyltransferase family 39 protein [Thermoanaerobaculia bacterium]|nr:glycosyltransferase family 39 protein [Thermoanaerobaculia bacterium]
MRSFDASAGSGPLDPAVRRAMVLVAAVFFVKASLLGLFVTPLWDVPDEIGHYVLIEDIVSGRGLPLMGRSVIPDDLYKRWMHRPAPSPSFPNWTAQHPPLYHLLAAPLLAAARAVTNDPEWQCRAVRLFSAFSAAAALLVFFAVFREASGDPLIAFVGAAGVGFLPMFTHMASGVNHDVFLALCMGVAALFFVRLARQGRVGDGLAMGAALAAAGATKLSALAPSAVLVGAAAFLLASRGARRARQWLVIAAAAASLPALWLLRHRLLLPGVAAHPTGSPRFDLDVLSYMTRYTVLDHTFKNFVGLIGWTGTGRGDVRWFQIDGPYLLVYLLLASAVATLAAAWIERQEQEHPSPHAVRLLSRALAAGAFATCFFAFLGGYSGVGLVKRFAYSLLIAVLFLGAPRVLAAADSRARIVFVSQLSVLVFTAAYLANSFEGYRAYGEMRATNGRYFFAVLPFLGLGYFEPAALALPAGRRRNLALAAVFAALLSDELVFFLLRVVPFYRAG